jgi:branched-subunit amino acid ABC-type transport system permease component
VIDLQMVRISSSHDMGQKFHLIFFVLVLLGGKGNIKSAVYRGLIITMNHNS